MVKKTIIMAILDGWGVGNKDISNPIFSAKPQTIEHIKRTYAAGALQASGIAVGLPWGEESNSQVGHLMLGAGKIVYQHFPRISISIKNGSFFTNEAIGNAFEHARMQNSNVHFVGLLTEEHVHASIDHLIALFSYADKVQFPRERIVLHIIVDHQENCRERFASSLTKLQDAVGNNIYIGSISGSYFAMDTDKHWDRTHEAYSTLTDKHEGEAVSLAGLLDSYDSRALSYTYIKPVLLDPAKNIANNDGVIFFNFRESSMRQLAHMFIDPTVAYTESHERTSIPAPKENLYITTFTEYHKTFPVAVAFPQDNIDDPLGNVLSRHGKLQLRLAETERYPHVTFFFNGLRQAPFKNEYRVLIPSRNIPDQRAHPEMMAEEVTARALTAINERAYDFILINYANADVMARTGDFAATTKAIQTIDTQIKKLMDAALATDGVLVITAGHGNAERVLDPLTGIPEVKNDADSVPIYVVGKEFARAKDPSTIPSIEHENVGVLSDVAPTILALMDIPKPEDMSGINILDSLR
jgi:2,3-bisphosphoglycerate-independent phosphoglycerate mutase